MPYCPNCGRENKGGYSYCGECGIALDELSTKSTTESSVNREETKERRSITIGSIILYTIGVLLIVGALGAMSSTPVGGIIILLSGVFLFPITRRWIKYSSGVTFSTWLVIVIVIVGFLVGAGAIGSGISNSSNGSAGKNSGNSGRQTEQSSTSVANNDLSDNQTANQSVGERTNQPEKQTSNSPVSREQINNNVDAISIDNATVVVEYSGGWNGHYGSNIERTNNYNEHAELILTYGADTGNGSVGDDDFDLGRYTKKGVWKLVVPKNTGMGVNVRAPVRASATPLENGTLTLKLYINGELVKRDTAGKGEEAVVKYQPDGTQFK